MSYTSIDDLPETVKKSFNDDSQKLFLKAYNHAEKEFGYNEDYLNKLALSVVKEVKTEEVTKGLNSDFVFNTLQKSKAEVWKNEKTGEAKWELPPLP